MLYKPYTAFGEFKNIMLHRNVPDLPMNTYGWSSIAPVKDNPNISDILGKERVAFHDTRIRHENRFDEVFETLDNLVKTLTNRKIRVIFVTTPVLSTYSKYTDSKINAVNKKAVLSLCQKYGCKYLDYFTDPRFTNDDFSDNDHLNCIGASKFSKILNKDI
jgi:poly-D-alanine transfer protein DltD